MIVTEQKAIECPSCKSTDIRYIQRITGYLAETDKWNPAKISELEDRVNHNGVKNVEEEN